ncbi:MAG TPA: lipoyl(octanoyl) transferase LipB [Planctomycetota bacterium]|nr:lipoyl(octanoyl) transferase LipB [Planctomycetota bacterium]
MTLTVERWGRVEYAESRARQLALVERRADGEIGDVLALCEHPPVITLGRGTDAADVLDRTIPTAEIERGGEATYHGPGQAVGYLIRRLPPGARDLHAHLRLLEDVQMDALRAFDVEGFREPGATGVWIRERGVKRKIASLGVAARRWTTFHGFALNVSTDLDAFRAIRPCGFDAGVMTSLERALGRRVPLDAVFDALAASAVARLR